MPGGEERLRAELERLARPADPEGAFDLVSSKKARRRLIHKVQVVGLTVAVVGGTAGGTFALAKVFSGDGRLAPAASLSANGRIAFVANGAGHREAIYTMEPDGTDLRKLTQGSWQDSQPVWSPDGTRMAFRSTKLVIDPVRGAAHTGPYELFVMNADGSGRRLLVKDPSGAGPNSPTWSPDGMSIAFTSERNEGDPEHCKVCNWEIYVIDADGTGLRRLTHDPTTETAPDWSPDGSSIAFVRNDVGAKGYPDLPPATTRTLVMRADGSATHTLLSCRGSACPDGLSPKWSPDGRSIAFFNPSAPGRPGVFVSDGHGGHLQFLKTCAGGCVVPMSGDWSPDGKQFVFEGGTQDFLGHTIWSMRADGSDLKQLRPPIAGDPAWQPVPAEQPQITPSVSETPRATLGPLASLTPIHTETPTVSPTPAGPSGQPPSLGFACGATSVSADFDGDGTVDTLVVYPSAEKLSKTPAPSPCQQPTEPAQGPFTIAIGWGSGGTEAWPFEQCVQGCAAYETQDLDGNGTWEVALIVDEGASTSFMDVYEVPNDHLGPILFEVGPPGTPQHPGFDPLKLAFGGSVTHQDFVTCQTGPNGGPQLIATSAVLSPDQTVWNLSETVFDFNGQAPPNDVPPRAAKAFTVASTRDYTEPFDPGGDPPTVPGDPCFLPTL